MDNNRISLSLCVWEIDDTTPDAITVLLSLAPNRTYVKGERRRPGTSATWRMSGWCRKSGVRDACTFEEHLDALCALIRPREEVFARLAEKYCVEIACKVEIDSSDNVSTPWLHLTKAHMQLLSKVGISVDFDIYRA